MRFGMRTRNTEQVPLIAVCLFILLGLLFFAANLGASIEAVLVLMLPCVFVLAFLSINSAQMRLYVFVGLGMLVMQSESGFISSLKPIYFLLVIAFGLMALSNVKYLDANIRKALSPVFLGSALLLVLIAIYVIYSLIQGEAPSRVIRDAFTYVLIVAAPFIGADASRESTLVSARLFVAGVTGLAAVSFSVFWLSARQVGVQNADRLFMFSIILSGLGIMLGIVYGMLRLRPVWLMFGIFCLLAVLVTGTRSGLLLVLGLLGALGAKHKLRIPLPKLSAGLLCVTGGAYLLLPAVSGRVSQDGFMDSRVRALQNVLEGGIESDASGVMRFRAYEILYEVWNDKPLFGVGFGKAFTSVHPGQAPVDFQLDSSMLILAKFGLFGAATMVVAIGLIFFGLLVFHKQTHARSEVQTVAAAFIFMVGCFFLLGLPMEDKGFAYSVCLLVYLLSVHNRMLLSFVKRPTQTHETKIHPSHLPLSRGVQGLM